MTNLDTPLAAAVELASAGPTITEMTRPDGGPPGVVTYIVIGFAVIVIFCVCVLGSADLVDEVPLVVRLIVGTVMAAVVAVVLASIAKYVTQFAPEKTVVERLEAAYGVAFYRDETLFGDSFSVPTRPSRMTRVDVLVDDIIRPCTLSTDSTRYTLACEIGPDAVVLEPRPT